MSPMLPAWAQPLLGTQGRTPHTHRAAEPRGSRHQQVQDLGVSVTDGISEHPLSLGKSK